MTANVHFFPNISQ